MDHALQHGLVPLKYQDEVYCYEPANHRIVSKNGEPLVFEEWSPQLSKPKVRSVHVWMSLTDVCNLGCKYCFSAENMAKNRQPLGTAKGAQIVAALAKQWARSERVVKIVFFGGEPLVRFEDLKSLVYFAKELGAIYGTKFDFQIATNAVLIDDRRADFLQMENVAVQVSIDGDKQTHDALRPFTGGRGSYDQVVTGIKKLMKRPSIRLNARPTLSRTNPSLKSTLEAIVALGFKVIHVEAVASNGQTEVAFDEIAVRHLESEIEVTADYLADLLLRGIKVFPFVEHLESLQSKQSRKFICGAGVSAFSFDVNGDSYPCHRFHGNEAFRLERNQSISGVHASEKFRILNTNDLSVCSRCWARRLCWGCCPAESVAFGRDIGEPNPTWCDWRRAETKLSLTTAIAVTAKRSRTPRAGDVARYASPG